MHDSDVPHLKLILEYFFFKAKCFDIFMFKMCIMSISNMKMI